jgi:hypothetical protein
MVPLLLKRFPSVRSPQSSRPVIPTDERGPYPSLAAEFDVLDNVVAKDFAAADLAALRHQNRYRRQQVMILLGSALVGAAGALQAMVSEQRWPGALLAVVSIATAAIGRTSRELNTLTDYLSERVKAERLRALHFLFLSRTGAYAGADREAALRSATLDIKSGKEPR